MKADIYLAGGFYADNWQEKVKRAFPPARQEYSYINFLDPKEKERSPKNKQAQKDAFSSPNAYTAWDLAAIDKSNIVFAYIDKENPAAGVIAEIGYAVGKGKVVILVIDLDHVYFKDRYFDFLRNMPGVVHFKTLEEGIAYTQAYLQVM